MALTVHASVVREQVPIFSLTERRSNRRPQCRHHNRDSGQGGCFAQYETSRNLWIWRASITWRCRQEIL